MWFFKNESLDANPKVYKKIKANPNPSFYAV